VSGRESFRTGLQGLEAATALLHRIRNAHPTAGLLEAADLQWWWRTQRSTDDFRQLFWFDDAGRPEAAVIATDWAGVIALDPIVMPDATPDWVAHVIVRGIAHVSPNGREALDVVIDRADEVARAVLLGQGFKSEDDDAPASSGSLSVVTAWLAVDARPTARPALSPLPEDYRLLSRTDTAPGPHHMVRRSGPEVEARLRQTSLYRPDLDLVVLDRQESVAAYALFWFDPDTATGLVEPMRTEEDHQRRGLARHLLTAGIGLLFQAGATRIKLCFKPDNAAAKALYLGLGFEPDKQTAVFSRRAG
jgi:ribosomal protein S18 acetylase RimI-like enzyme